MYSNNTAVTSTILESIVYSYYFSFMFACFFFEGSSGVMVFLRSAFVLIARWEWHGQIALVLLLCLRCVSSLYSVSFVTTEIVSLGASIGTGTGCARCRWHGWNIRLMLRTHTVQTNI